MYKQFSGDVYEDEYGFVEDNITVMGNGKCILASVVFSQGSMLGTQQIPVSMLQIVDSYTRPDVKDIVIFRDYWKDKESFKYEFDLTNINGVGGDGAGPFIDDELSSIYIRTNLKSTATSKVILGDYIYMFGDSYVMQKVKLKYIIDLDWLRVQKSDRQIITVSVDEVLKDKVAACVIWNPQKEQYEPIYLNQMLGYNDEYYHTFDAMFDWNVKKWKICLREIGGGDNLLWTYGENLKPVFDHKWVLVNGKFFEFETNIFQGDANYDEAGRFTNQGDLLRKLLKNFDQNANEIKRIVDDIKEDGINFTSFEKHKRFNKLGLAMEESVKSDS